MKNPAQINSALLAFVFFLIACSSFGQTQKIKPFIKEEYPADRYSVKSDTFRFQRFKIELTQAKLLDPETFDKYSTYCRVWLNVKSDSGLVDRVYLDDCEALGGCSGIFVSDEQPRQDYFLLSKFGDYSGRVYIIDTSGKIKSYYGGHYFISDDLNYLFSTYDSDIGGITVFDLAKNKVLYTTDTLTCYITDFYFFDNQYFGLVANDEKKPGVTEIATYNMAANHLILSMEEDSYIGRAKALKGYNMISVSPCNCGRRRE